MLFHLLFKAFALVFFSWFAMASTSSPRVGLPSHYEDEGLPVIALRTFTAEEETLITERLGISRYRRHQIGTRPLHYIPWDSASPITEDDIYAIAAHERERYLDRENFDSKWQRTLIFVTGTDDAAIATRWTSNNKQGARLDAARLSLQDVGRILGACVHNDGRLSDQVGRYQEHQYMFDARLLPEEDTVPAPDITLTALSRLSAEQIEKLKHDATRNMLDATINIVQWERDDIATRDDIFRICKSRHPYLGDRRTSFYEFFIDGLLQDEHDRPQILIARQDIYPENRTLRPQDLENEELFLTRLATASVTSAWIALVTNPHDWAEQDFIKQSYTEVVPNPDKPLDFHEDNFATPTFLLCRFSLAEQRQVRTALDELCEFEHDASLRRTIFIQFATAEDVSVRDVVQYFDQDPAESITEAQRFKNRPFAFVTIERKFLTEYKASLFYAAHVYDSDQGTWVGYDYGVVAAKYADSGYGNLELANMNLEELVEMEEEGVKRIYFASCRDWALGQKAIEQSKDYFDDGSWPEEDSDSMPTQSQERDL